MDPMEEIKQMFFVECEELLEALQDGLEQLLEDPTEAETVATIFRAVHSMKGGAGAFGLEDLVGFAHNFETVLDALRSNRLEPTDEVLTELQRSADILNDLVYACKDGTDFDQSRADAQIVKLQALLANEGPADASADEPAAVAEPAAAEEADGGASFTNYLVKFKPHSGLYERGSDPALLIRDLCELAVEDEPAEIECDISAIPEIEDIDPGQSFLSWEIRIKSEATEAGLAEVFEFVEGDCDLVISSVNAPAEPETAETEADMEVDVPAPKPQAQADSAPAQVSDAPADAPAASADPEKPASATPAPAAAKKPAPKTEKAREPAKGGGNATVRVDLDRVDRLINLVGELVINQAMLSQSVVESGLANSTSIAVGLEEFKHLTREVQESVLAIRAQPVKSLFQRMSRIVREAADATGKKVNIVSDGEMTEVDKTVIERLADPLTHMIRNAVDHGLESPEKRTAAGKDEVGTVSLIAEHRSGRVLIEVSDDGAGINRERVFQIAVDKGLISPDAQLSNSEIDNLLFLPGFSTAEKVSDLSGRGVGMDVVKRSIASLGGRINISSNPGKGTIFSISLPLTLAILDGMIVSVGSETVVVPLSAILEMLKPEEAQIHPLGSGESVLQVRGEFVPTIDVAYQLGFGPKLENYNDRVILLIETSDGGQRALVVDSIQDQRQVVIKGLEENYGEVSGIAAATILGDGRIALILDPDAIVNDAQGGGPTHNSSFALAG
ncbi:chemotaxis protein CheA [Amaricoccus tamworthensis]|uniref:chemotaxis protein CheA n=1 Tax=Amaricoccus tamworthensis TaxID=57002 RepID=UPI003C7B6534